MLAICVAPPPSALRLRTARQHRPRRGRGATLVAMATGVRGVSALTKRAAPSLRYLQNVPPFSEHFFENDGNDSEDQGPTGGYTWDGRVSSTHDQARIPLHLFPETRSICFIG